MCGIAGFWLQNKGDISQLKKMTDALVHRGPDGEGQWISKSGNVGLGHRRLSIIDLSNNAAQPMSYESNFMITFNGEIYNYLELKSYLTQQGFVFKTHSDTEVLLAAYKHWATSCLAQLDGMFAFAIYDIKKNELFCARDRFGEKPFYYTFYKGNFYFASEMKAFWSLGVPKEIDYTMVYNFLVNDLVENPNDQKTTFYRNIYKLKNSSFFIYRGDQEIVQKNYWNIDATKTNDVTFDQAVVKFRELLETSVKRRLRSDVPVGTSLSGGLDSSSVVSLVSKQLNNNHTFSARFKDFAKDEGKYIDIVSNRFKSIHHNVLVDAEMLNESIDKLMYHQEEPFQTGSIFAQYKVYEKARQEKIIVMLDGQGADEFLCGYDKDFSLYSLDIFPNFLALSRYRKNIKNNHSKIIDLPLQNMLIKYMPALYKTIRQYKDAKIKDSPNGINSEFHYDYCPQVSPFHVFGSLKETLKHEMSNQGLEKLLKFADRNSMAHSIEVRLPFLFHELVEFVFSLQSEFLVKEGWSKALLRKAMQADLPNKIVYRKDKIGFEAPSDLWANNIEMRNYINTAKQELINNKIIVASYTDNWKILVLSKFLEVK